MKTILTTCLLAGLLLGAAACGDAFIDPFENDDRFFTIYGYLDVLQRDHAVRVIPVTRFPERIESPADAQASIDAEVTSTDLRTGQTVRWRHSLERLDDGTYGHIFRAPLFVQSGRTYRLEVTRSDGIMAWAETTVPSPFRIETNLADAWIDLDNDSLTQEIHLENVPSPWDIVVVYRIGTILGATPYRIPYGRVGEPTDDGDWRFTVDIARDYAYLKSIPNAPAPGTWVRAMGVVVRVLDDNWTPPEGVFDPEVLAQPGTLSNVENGYGFWGAIGVYRNDWAVSTELRELLGF